ncbi:hypothetical protein [Streptomyces lonarensis]|uniref:Uncharacterized protein n=1 Tax=Streptomyces lonarensis TaxID=700599 RepID=A0A7X6CZG1_9ACTN|nr:hypothetical protein [Streptomyces lonarensis]NJQ05388.1 hypothetical protein [Streptomyces lonarensis]
MPNDLAHSDGTGEQEDTAGTTARCARLAAALGLLVLPFLLPAALRPGAAAPHGPPFCAVPSCATGGEVYAALALSVALGIWTLCAPAGRAAPVARALCVCGQAWALLFVLSVAG